MFSFVTCLGKHFELDQSLFGAVLDSFWLYYEIIWLGNHHSVGVTSVNEAGAGGRHDVVVVLTWRAGFKR